MDVKCIRGSRRSEIQEMREELQKASKDRRKDAIKKIIGAMTLGKDVSSLFPEVVNCIQTNNLELKKLVYLALAVRTMGYIRLPAITEYLVEPLKRCYVDPDPYVRKTVAICIAKLYGISPQLVIDEGFIEILEKMLSDANPMVVANAVSTLMDISEKSEENLIVKIIHKNPSKLEKILSSLNESMEWGQVYILDALALYKPLDQAEAKSIVEAVLPRFSHINPAVVLSAIKVVIRMMAKFTDKEYVKILQGKLVAPLVTLASLEQEIQYVALRSIMVIIEKWPRLLEGHVRAFFCKNNDKLYVRVEKLDIIVKLAAASNFQKILSELREYASDIDLDFVKKAIRAIGALAIRLEAALSSCIAALTDLLRLKAPHITEECTIVYRDILRAYPHVFSDEVFSLCADGEYLHGFESKSALVWIVGQYANRIADAADYVSNLAETFHEEHRSVQLTLLTAAVKVTLVLGTGCGLVDTVLRRALYEGQSPDVRCRAQMYLKILEQGHELASKLVMTPLPPIGESVIEKDILENLLSNLGHVSSVYHLPSWAVVFKKKQSLASVKEKVGHDDTSSDDELLDIHGGGDSPKKKKSLDLYEDDDSDRHEVDDIDDFFNSHGKILRYSCKDEVVLTPYQQGSNGQMGLQVVASLYREEEKILLKLQLTNKTSAVVTLQAIQFNKNSFGLSPASSLETPVVVSPEKTSETHVLLSPNVVLSNTPPDNPITLQIAIKTNVDVFYFRVFYELPIVLLHDAFISRSQFQDTWVNLPGGERVDLEHVPRSGLSDKMYKVCLSFVGSGLNLNREVGEENEAYYSMTTNSLRLLAVISGNQLCVKADAAALLPLFVHTIKKALSQ
ncbi:armadillo-like helical protein [Babesia gibsoni]|uniref:Armadillo-like helical protein n=1 Tax=Babesia gibsoni TaxID=33632 RepID=A0AAD8PFQ6_BABGI|nr:armadillo-like helical protein [Babesia gibsoni]